MPRIDAKPSHRMVRSQQLEEDSTVASNARIYHGSLMQGEERAGISIQRGLYRGLVVNYSQFDRNNEQEHY